MCNSWTDNQLDVAATKTEASANHIRKTSDVNNSIKVEYGGVLSKKFPLYLPVTFAM